MKKWCGVLACLWILGVYLGALLLPIGDTTAQDAYANRIAAMETQVAFLKDYIRVITPSLLPPPETDPSYSGNMVQVHASSVFRMYCTLHDTAVMSASPLYALDCSRIDPAVDPLINR